MVKVKVKVYEKINNPPLSSVSSSSVEKESISQAARLERYLTVL